jgi:chromosome segregation ATPase
MSETAAGEGLRERIARQGEDALGKLAQDLLENPLVHGAIARAFEAREKAAQAQEVAMGALNLPSAADLERLTRRVRSLAQRLEGIEDGVDRLDERLASLGATAALDERLDAILSRLDEIAKDLGALKVPQA